ncbi:I78 family peptidase inhibitor [Frigidibacter sp.]|uniref:I78 family peptidase inhibitor n=1 Tax=Frigidibacter sp. TaxID=2586418 RepID=UPI002733CD07|nr:I78 family peptidase inhibitor [Frigidibacter sp.]MDP3339485.1 I78 family peptidase inhibitor [Frigidibacter sp.]
MAGFPGRHIAGGAALLLLAACVTEGGTGAGPAPGTDDCGAAGLQQLVGQPASRLETMRFSQPLRVINPGQMVTMDYSESRLNIAIDESGRISRVYCG